MALKWMSRLALLGTAAAGGGYFYYQNADANTQFKLMSDMGPVLRLLDAETTHILGIMAAQNGLFPVETRPDPPSLRTKVWGLDFPNPIGLAAGFDKHAEIIEPMMRMGFGFVEVGSITPKPQPGNPKPRVFRIPECEATINRYGFNSLGADAVQDNLLLFAGKARRDPSAKTGVLGVNLGKNKSSKDAGTDYSIGMTKLAELGDYVVINISSPNTPGLRALQNRRELEELVKQVKGTRDRMKWDRVGGAPPLLIKIAPDLSELDKKDIADVCLEYKIDGLIVSNTTIARPPEVAKSPAGNEAGGLSGRPLFEASTEVLSDMYRLTGGKIPIVGCGGVSSGEDAYKKIRAGASLVQIYTSMAYQGPIVLPRIKSELAELLARDGYTHVSQAVGADHKLAPAGGAAASAGEGAPRKSWWRFW